MTSRKKYIIEKIAQRAREVLIDNSIITSEDREIPIEKMRKIVDFFGGTLIKDDQNVLSSTNMKKIGNNSFEIHYTENSTNIDILHELGHAFFDLETMEINTTMSCEGSEESDIIASLFARSLYMPRIPFEKTTIECSNNGHCNIDQVASIYSIARFDVLTRGEELNIWK